MNTMERSPAPRLRQRPAGAVMTFCRTTSNCSRLTRAVAVAVLIASSIGVRHGVAAQQAPPPSTQPSEALRANLVRLGDPNPRIREEARTALLGIDRSELAALRTLVAELRPLSPAQTNVLRDVVIHVYLAGETYASEDVGFLGIKALEPAIVADDARGDELRPIGIVIESRMPGFPAYRYLQDGDILLAAENPNSRLYTISDLRTVVEMFRVGQSVRLQVIRAGELMVIAVPVAARPAGMRVMPDAPNFDSLRQDQTDRAIQYFDREFSPLVEPQRI